MATEIITKFSSTPSSVPSNTDLVQGELAVNTADKRLYTEDNGNVIIELGTNPSSITTGTISATGTITGNVTGNLTGNADTATTATTAGTVTTAAQPNITSLGTLTELTVDNLTFNGAAITSDTGAISFGNENLTTTGTLDSGAITVSTNGNATLGISIDNSSGGTAARAGINIECDGAAGGIYATSSAYTTVPSWQDALVITNSSLHSGGTIINAQSGGVKLQTSLTDRYVIDASGNHDFQAGNITTTGTLDVGGNTIIGSTSVTPDGTLHVHTASAGVVTANSVADDVIIEGSGDTGLSLLAGAGNNTNIYFGEGTDNNIARVTYAASSSLFALGPIKAGATTSLRADNDVTNLTLSGASGSELATFAGDVTLSDGKVSITDTANETALTVTSSASSTNAVDINSTSLTSGSVITLSNSSVTSGNGINMDNFDSLTSGSFINATSNSASTTTRSLFYMENENSAAVNATVMTLKQDAAQRALFIDQDGDGTSLSIDSEATTADAVSITAAATTGDAMYIRADSLTTGHGLYVYSNSSSGGGTRTLANIWNDNPASINTTGLTVRQDAAQRALFIDQNGDGTSLNIDSEATTADTVYIDAENTTGDGINMRMDALTTGAGLQVYSNSASTSTRNLTALTNDNALATNATVLKLQQDADQRALYVDQNGAAPAIEVDGGGIKFTNATASSDVNTLDDYEEGTWSPVFTCGTSGTITLNTGFNTGTYTKVGNLVTINFAVQIASVSSPLGTLNITGLPFTSATDTQFEGRALANIHVGSPDTIGVSDFFGILVGASSQIAVQAAAVADRTAVETIVSPQFTGAGYVTGSLSYRV